MAMTEVVYSFTTDGMTDGRTDGQTDRSGLASTAAVCVASNADAL